MIIEIILIFVALVILFANKSKLGIPLAGALAIVVFHICVQTVTLKQIEKNTRPAITQTTK